MGSGFDNSIYWIILRRNYNSLLYFDDCCICDTQTIITISRLTIQLLNCFERRLPDKSSRKRSRSRSLLPATSRQAHTWHRAPLGPMANSIHCFLYRLGTEHVKNTVSIVDETSLLLVAFSYCWPRISLRGIVFT
jgi:hypothetical protein